MAIVTKTIGPGGDYASYAAWELDLDNSAIYAAGDIAHGQPLAGALTAGATIARGATVALGGILIKPALAQAHAGVAGAGARIVRTANGRTFNLTTPIACSIEDLEIDYAGFDFTTGEACITLNGTGALHALRRVMLHGFRRNTASTSGRNMIDIGSTGTSPVDILSCLLYDCIYTNTSSGGMIGILDNRSAVIRIIGNTVFGLVRDGGTGTITGIQASGATVRNNVAGVSGTTTGAKNALLYGTGSTVSNNASVGDNSATTIGTGNLGNLDPAATFENAATFDLRLKAGAAAINAGIDLGVTPDGVQFTINGRDRDAAGDTWDMGAWEYVGVGAVTPGIMEPRVIYMGF